VNAASLLFLLQEWGGFLSPISLRRAFVGCERLTEPVAQLVAAVLPAASV
jgi:hypothetical protein